jgi:glyoxylase-like metal-dependent hydrolase (beta-lactamase superfamily II)
VNGFSPAPISVGSLTILPVFDGTARLEASQFVQNGQPTDWSNHRHALDERNGFTVPVGGFIIKTGGRTVLLDAGVGHTTDPMFTGGELLTSMRTYGLEPGDIDTVFLSHLHSDHMGWVEVDGVPTFPNADIHLGAKEWEFVVKQAGFGHKRASRMNVVKDRINLIDGDGVTIAPGITTRQTPGHTPGHTSVIISSGDERIIMLGDALHCPAQLTETEWEVVFDTDPALAKKTRQALLREAESPGTALLPCHLPGMSPARLVHTDGKRSWMFSAQQ